MALVAFDDSAWADLFDARLMRCRRSLRRTARLAST
jgi:hypothetical protein